MSSKASTAEVIAEASATAGRVRIQKMFGEFAVYLDDKVVALICDDTLFLKATTGAIARLPDAELGHPYPGAKPHIIGSGLIDEPAELVAVLRAIWADLPEPKPRKTPRART